MPAGLPDPDVVIIGSGPCGAMAARALVNAGRSVLMLDYGRDNPDVRSAVPEAPFSAIRRTCRDQARFFIGQTLEGVPTPGVRVGAQLTPPRQFVHAETDTLLPIVSETFHPMQSLALGGLGAAWGTACFAYSPEELRRIGIVVDGIDNLAARVAQEIGISVDRVTGTEAERWWRDLPTQLPALEIDDNATVLRNNYANRAAALHRDYRFFLGSIPLAVLSRDHSDRQANPYHDMDFYTDGGRSAYRPRYTIEALRGSPSFRYEGGVLARHFREDASGVEVDAVKGGAPVRFRGKRLLLCAGAINSARLALNSLPELGDSTTLLCNPYLYVPCLHWPMLGRSARDRRHSLAQLAAHLELSDDPAEHCSIQIYSYRSLLLFKLVKEMPLPAWAGLLVARSLVNALLIFGVLFPDAQADGKVMTLRRTDDSGVLPALEISYALTDLERRRQRELMRRLRRVLRSVQCFSLGAFDPGAAGSVHYAGTIPFTNPRNPRFVTRPDYRLAHLRHVFVGDSASWNWLPCKGPTFTAMANTLRVAELIHGSL